MRSQKAWSLVALLFAACAIPDVEIVSSLGSDAGAASEDGGGKSDHGGSPNGSGKAGSTSETTNAGTESSNTAGDATGDSGGSPEATGGTTGAGGKATGGSGGSRPSGGSTGTGGTSGSGGSGGIAVGKFCSEVTFSGAPISLRLEVGSGANKVTFVTSSRTCTPLVTKACNPIPLGSAVLVTLLDPSTNPPTVLGATTADVLAGQAWVFWAGFDGTAPFLDTDNTYTPAACKADDFETIASGA
jgi:hypothetical protein